MQTDRGRKIRLGLFIVIGTLIFVAFFYLVGSSSQLFSKSMTLHTNFPSVSGLRTGDHVRFSGMIVGTISDLEIATENSVKVDMSIDRKMARFIRKDSKVEIKPEALIGDKMIVIYSGTSDAAQVSEGDFLDPIESIHLEAIMHDLSGEIKQIEDIIVNLVEITGKINEGDGSVSQILNEPDIAYKLDKTADNFVSITDNLKTLSIQLNNPESDLGKLIYRDQLTTRMDSILITMDSIARTTHMATKDMALTSAELVLTAEAINNGDGAVNKILYDSAFADTLGYAINNLNQTLIELEKVAVNLQHKKLFGGTKEKK